MSPDEITDDEQTTKEELLFVLHHRDKPTLVFIQCQSNAKRDELERCLRDELSEYQFVSLDVTPLPVTSLVRTLSERLPDAVKKSAPVSCVVNVHGLENRLDEHLAAQLNLERELLFRSVPYITIIWADAYFFRKLQKLAPDLWHWVTYKFRFDDPTVPVAEQQMPLPASVLPQKGNIEERQERIQTLEERYAHLNLDDSNRIRLLRDKVSTLSLLADEYVEAFEFGKAIEAYQTAIGLETQLQEAAVQAQVKQAAQSGLTQAEAIQPDTFQLAQLLFNLGWAYLKTRSFKQALEAYNRVKSFLPDQAGVVYHQIGWVYAEQRQWAEALENYRQALTWNEQTGNTFELGSTYHQIGRVYEEQQMLSEASEWFTKALLNLAEHDHPDQSIAEESVARIQKKLAAPSSLP